MAEEKFEFGGQSFVYEKNETNWELKLKRSDVASQDLRELLLLDLHHPFFWSNRWCLMRIVSPSPIKSKHMG